MHESKWTIKCCIMGWKSLCVHQGNSDCDGTGKVDFKQLPHRVWEAQILQSKLEG